MPLDPTLRPELQEELREVHARHDAILNALSDLMFVLTPEGVYVDFHARDQSDLVAPPQAFLGKNVRDLFPPGLAGAFTASFAEAMETGGPCTVEYSLPIRGSLRHYEARVVRCGSERVLSLVRDVTEGKRAADEARELRNELAHAGRVTVLGALAASLAHEINQPLAAVMANAQVALRMLASPQPDLGELREVLNDIVADDRRAGDVLHQLRAFVRKGPPRHRLIDVNATVQEVARLLDSDVVGRGIWLEVHPGPQVPRVLADRVQLQQVLLNLLMNAFDAVADREVGGRRVIVRTGVEGEQVIVSVVDHGVGVPAEKLPRLFEPFFTTKSEGVGLGLSICRTIVSAHGGVLRGERNPDRGMTFCFSLPVSTPGDPRREPPGPPIAAT